MKYIITIALLILSFSSQAAPVCSKNGTTVIYTNGVTTKRVDADWALFKIKQLGLNSQIDLKPEKVRYRLAYNYEESISLDFLEAAVQRFPTGFLQSLGVTNGYAAYMGYLNGGLSDAIYAVALNSITDRLVELQSNWLINYRSGSLYLKTIQEIKGHYETAFNNGERVFAISHSQGGLFMSDAFGQTSFTDKQKYFSGFQIASPLASEMNSHFGYATHDKDRLINFVRTSVGALSANVNAPLIVNNSYEGVSDYATDFVINHGIVTTYLNDSTIKSQVIPKLIEAAQLLESNCPKAVINYTKNNLVVNFDSTDPEDPSVTGLTYSWNFGDGQTANTTSKTLSHTYAQAGTYNVSLIVNDAYGANDSANTSLSTANLGTKAFTICNGGNATSTMTFIFQIQSIDSFSLDHSTVYDGQYSFTSTCECKTFQAPVGEGLAVHIDAISLRIFDPEYEPLLTPIDSYDGIINYDQVFNNSLTFSLANADYTPPEPQRFKIVQGQPKGGSCDQYTYK